MKKEAVIVFSLFLLTGAVVLFFSSRGRVEVAENRLDNLPMAIGSWTGEERHFADYIYEALNADANIYRRYIHENSRDLYLYLGYYGTERGGRAEHQPIYCYPSSGWDIVSDEPYEFTGPDGSVIRVKKIVVKQNDMTNIALYWTQTGNNKILIDGWGLNTNSFIRRLLKNRNDGAFVRVSAVRAPGGEKDTLRDLEQFSAALIPLLPQVWPIEKES